MAKATIEIRSLARAHTSTAIRVLAGIMEQDTAPAPARVAAAQALLDRGWGKPTQEIEIEHTGQVTLKSVVVSQLTSFFGEATGRLEDRSDEDMVSN